MKVSILQIDVEWGSAQENISRAEALMAQAPGSDLYVLPEMWSTGFATEPQDIAEIEENTSCCACPSRSRRRRAFRGAGT